MMNTKPLDLDEFNEDPALKLLHKEVCCNFDCLTVIQYNKWYYCQNGWDLTHCAIYLGETRGEYDMLYYSNAITQIAKKQSYTVETISLDDTKWVFDLRYDFNIVVDSNDNTLIEINVKPKLADDAACVCHYTSIESAVEILQRGGFFAKSLNRYNSEKYFNDNAQQRKTVFDVSFCGNMVDDDKMWDNFAKKHKGCKLEFYFKSGLKDAFTVNEPLKCCNEKEENLVGYVKPKSIRYSYSNENELVNSHVYVDISYQHMNYEKQKRNNSNVFITDENAYNLVLNRVALSAKNEFEYQNEIRIRVLLQSPRKVSLPPFDRIFLPYDMDKIDKINIKVGKKASESDLQKMMCLIKENNKDKKKFFVGREN